MKQTGSITNQSWPRTSDLSYFKSYEVVLFVDVCCIRLLHSDWSGVCDVIELMSCHWSGVCDVTELMSCHWSGEDASAAGDRFIHDRDVNWLRQSDGEIIDYLSVLIIYCCWLFLVWHLTSVTSVVVAEVTQPSLGVGYELGRVVDMKKKTLCLFRPSSARGENTSCFTPLLTCWPHPLISEPMGEENDVQAWSHVNMLWANANR